MKVLFVTLDKCPDIDAGAVRIHMIAKMFGVHGYEATVISMGPYTNYRPIVDDGISYISFRSRYGNVVGKILSYLFYPLILNRLLKIMPYDVCVHTQVCKSILKVIHGYSRKYGAETIYDAVEWFSPEQFKYGVHSWAYKLNNAYNTRLISKPHKVIAISSYLYKNFQGSGIDTIQIPAVLAVKDIPYKKELLLNKIKIIYAGSPGKKDYLHIIIEALMLLDLADKAKIQLVIIGCTENQLTDGGLVNHAKINALKGVINFRGRISRNEVIQEYLKADFSILIRSSELRYAQAGFPTKFVESLATATPIICNLTSDIGEYIMDKKNGVVVDGDDAVSCSKALQYVATLDLDKRRSMQNFARFTAECYFDFSKYSDDLIRFVEDKKGI